VRRGDIWLVDLDPTVGSEIRKRRPCVVVSPVEIHDHLLTVIVAPMTTGGHEAPFRIPVNHAGRNGLILLDQLRAVNKLRLGKKLGAVAPMTLTLTLKTLQEVFAE
jgi:mRNA interferase MazF